MNITQKLFSGYGILAAILLIVVFFANQTMNNIERHYHHLTDHILPEFQALEGIKFSGLRIISSVNELGLIIKEEVPRKLIEERLRVELDLINAGKSNLLSNVRQYRNVLELTDEEEVQFLKSLEMCADQIIIKSEKLKLDIIDSNGQKNITEMSESLEDTEQEFLFFVNAAIKHDVGEIHEIQAVVSAQIDSALRMITIFSLVALLVYIGVSIWFSRSIITPIRKLRDATEKIGQGNFDVSLKPSSKDETGQLTQAFSDMLDKLNANVAERNQIEKERKEVQVTLDAANEKYSVAFRSCPDPISITNIITGRIIEVNNSFLTAVGWSRDEVIGKTTIEINLWVDEQERDLLTTELEEKGAVKNFRCKFRSRNGGVYEYDLSAEIAIIRDIPHMLAVSHDVTQSVLKDKTLLKSNRALNVLMECNYALQFATDEKELFNKICKIVVETGDSRMAAIGLADNDENKQVNMVAYHGNNSDYFIDVKVNWRDDNEHGLGPVGRALRTGQPSLVRDMETEGNFGPWRKSALERGLRSNITLPLISNEDRLGVLLIYSSFADDIDYEELQLLSRLADNLTYGIISLRAHKERKQMEEQLNQHQIQLENEIIQRTHDLTMANQELEAYASTISHDLKAPLRAIEGFADFLHEDYQEQLDDTGHQYLTEIQSGAGRMSQMIDDLLLHARLGEQLQDPTQVDINEVVQHVLVNLQHDIQAHGAKIHIDKNLPVVTGHQIALEMMMQNLISNAIKFVASDRTPDITVRMQTNGKEHTLSVKDNGIGIAVEHQKSIFNIFDRLHSQEEYPGTGIGLAIVKKVTDLHKGHIWIDSKPGKGSIFNISLNNS